MFNISYVCRSNCITTFIFDIFVRTLVSFPTVQHFCKKTFNVPYLKIWYAMFLEGPLGPGLNKSLGNFFAAFFALSSPLPEISLQLINILTKFLSCCGHWHSIFEQTFYTKNLNACIVRLWKPRCWYMSIGFLKTYFYNSKGLKESIFETLCVQQHFLLWISG